MEPSPGDVASPAPPLPVPVQAPVAPAPPPPAEEGIDALAERLLPSDLDALAAALPDERLAGLALAAVRQLRRRMSRSGPRGGRAQGDRHGGKRGGGGGDPLGRALRQLADELGGTPGE